MISFNNIDSFSKINYNGNDIVKACVGTNEVWPNTEPHHDYSSDYLTFETLVDGTFSFTKRGGGNIQYSLDNGATWTILTSGSSTPTVTSGNKILWKGNLTPNTVDFDKGIGVFSAGIRRFNVEGNVMSLLYGDNFIGQTDLTGKDWVFGELFDDNRGLVSAENLILPATILSSHCYFEMFGSCHSLTTAPELPATTLAEGCYFEMFEGCASLTTAPQLPVTTLADRCYECMFYNCSSLTTAPQLPALVLTNLCYASMFWGCTSLTTAPDLNALTLARRCYYNMFNGCSSLNYIKCLATDISAELPTYQWVKDVPSVGTFVKNALMNDWTTGVDGIPNGWQVQDA